jgi:hypothetical protein
MTGEGIAGPRAMRPAVGGVAAALFTWWAVHDGGTAQGSWYPGALLCLAALAAFTVWSFLSVSWADARGADPHSIVFRTLGQTGMVGVVLLTALHAAAFAGIRSKRPRAVAAHRPLTCRPVRGLGAACSPGPAA